MIFNFGQVLPCSSDGVSSLIQLVMYMTSWSWQVRILPTFTSLRELFEIFHTWMAQGWPVCKLCLLLSARTEKVGKGEPVAAARRKSTHRCRFRANMHLISIIFSCESHHLLLWVYRLLRWEPIHWSRDRLRHCFTKHAYYSDSCYK